MFLSDIEHFFMLRLAQLEWILQIVPRWIWCRLPTLVPHKQREEPRPAKQLQRHSFGITKYFKRARNILVYFPTLNIGIILAWRTNFKHAQNILLNMNPKYWKYLAWLKYWISEIFLKIFWYTWNSLTCMKYSDIRELYWNTS